MLTIYAKPGAVIPLGREGENNARRIVFDLKPFEEVFGPGVAQLIARRTGEDAPYPVAVELDGSHVIWTVNSADTAIPGRYGEAELRYMVGETLAKSERWATTVIDALGTPSDTPPEPQQSWVDQVLDAATRAEEAAERAENAGGGDGGGSGNIPEDLENRLETLEDQMADLLYTAIAISSFSHNAGTKEMGSTLTAVTLTWATNKAPTALTLDGATLDPALTSKALTGLSIKANKTWTLKATDERGAAVTKTTTVSFQNGIYYGAKAVPETIDSAFIMGLGKKELSGTKNRSVSVTGGDGLYFWYAYPKRLGTSLFNIGGFDYEYGLETVSFTNQYGYTEDYYVYRSGQYAPASLSVTVKNGG